MIISVRYQLGTILVLGAAEVGSSLWLLLRFPSDGPINAYAGFLGYEAGRLVCWIPLAGFCSLLCLWLRRRSVFASSRRKASIDESRGVGASFELILAFMLGFAIETITSLCYWATPYSRGVRALYESAWYWDRVPRQNDYGWPSLKGYLFDHLIP